MERVLQRRVRARPRSRMAAVRRRVGARPWSRVAVVRRRLGLQFLVEALMMTAGGTIVGALLGAAVTVACSLVEGQALAVSMVSVVVGLAGGLLVGAIAGLYPAVRVLRAIDASS